MTLEEFINLEEEIDEERTKIAQWGKPVSDENYNIWRKERDVRRAKIRSEKEKEKLSKTTGIEIFKNSQNNNTLIQDDEGAADDIKLEDRENIDVVEEIIKQDEFFRPMIKDDGIFILFNYNKENTLDELTKKLQGIKVNAELFGGDVDFHIKIRRT